MHFNIRILIDLGYAPENKKQRIWTTIKNENHELLLLFFFCPLPAPVPAGSNSSQIQFFPALVQAGFQLIGPGSLILWILVRLRTEVVASKPIWNVVISLDIHGPA